MEIKEGIVCSEYYTTFFKDYIEYWSGGGYYDVENQQTCRIHIGCYWMILE